MSIIQLTEQELVILTTIRELNLHEKVTLWRDHNNSGEIILKVEKNIILKSLDK